MHSLSSPYLFGIDMAILRAQSVALGKGVVRSTFQQDTMYKAKMCCRSKQRGLNQTWSGDSRRIFSTWQVKAQKPRRITYTPCNHSVAFETLVFCSNLQILSWSRLQCPASKRHSGSMRNTDTVSSPELCAGSASSAHAATLTVWALPCLFMQ